MKLGKKKTQKGLGIAAIIIIFTVSVTAVLSVVNGALMYESERTSMERNLLLAADGYADSIHNTLAKYKLAAEAVGRESSATDLSLPLEERMAILADLAAIYGFKDASVADMAGNTYTGANISDREYFQKASQGITNVSSLVVRKTDSSIVMFVAAPVQNDTDFEGIVYCALDQGIFDEAISKIKVGEKGYAFVLDKAGQVLAYPGNPEIVTSLKNFKTGKSENAETAQDEDINPDMLDLSTKMTSGESGVKEFSMYGSKLCAGYTPILTDEGWSLAVIADRDEMMAGFFSSIKYCVAIAVIAVILAIVFGNIIGHAILRIARRLGMLADGDVATSIGKRGKSKELRYLYHSTESLVHTFGDMFNETMTLKESAMGGQLFARGDAARFNGAYKDIVEGFNQVLDAIINPLRVTAEYLKRIAQGDIPEKIEESYSGDFEKLKEDINGCINAVSALVEDTRMLSDAAIAGDFLKRADEGRHMGDFQKVVGGVNQTLDVVVDKALWYQAIIDAIPNPISVTDMNMNWTLLNTAFETAIAGKYKCRDEAYGHACSNANVGICSSEECGIRKLMAAGTSESAFQWGQMSERQNTVYLKDRKGENIGFVEIITDLSEIASVSDYTAREIDRLGSNLKKLATGNLNFDLNIEAAGEFTVDAAEQFGEIATYMGAVKNSINNMITDAEGMIEAAVDGDLYHRADISKHQGDYATIVEGFNKTLEALIEPITEMIAVLRGLAEGNLNARMREDHHGDYARIASDMNEIMQTMGSIMSDINRASEEVAIGSQQVAEGSQSLSQGATEQASALEELNSTINDIANQTKQNALNANRASELSLGAKNHADDGNERMQEMLVSMEEINESSENISRIIKLIDGIAFQTNILALNAAVEAARAGEHGKGFAVVAEEVRNLAARSAEAARDTTALIEGSIEKIAVGTEIAHETADVLGGIVKEVDETTALIQDIAQASNDQASAIAQIDKGIEQVSIVVQHNSETSQESAAASQQLHSQAEHLKEIVAIFNAQDGETKALPQG